MKLMQTQVTQDMQLTQCIFHSYIAVKILASDLWSTDLLLYHQLPDIFVLSVSYRL